MITAFARVLGNRNFLLLWLAQVFSQIALNILIFVLAIEIYRITGSNTAVSLMMMTFGVPAIIFGVIFGGIVDFFDNRTVLLICNILRLILLIFYFFFSTSIFMLYFLSVAVSIITQMFIPAEVPSISKLVEKEGLLPANSLFTITFYLATVIGSLAAGPMIKAYSSTTTFLIMAVFMAFATYLTWRLPKIAKTRVKKFSPDLLSFAKPIFEGFIFIHRHERIRQSLLLLTFSQSLIATLAILAPGFADKILLLPIEDVSLVVMGPAVAGLISGALLVNIIARRFLRGKVIIAGIILTGLTLVWLATISSYNGRGMIYLVMILLGLLGFSNSLINVPSSTIIQEDTDENMRGRVYGVLTSMTGGMSVIPVLFSGILADSVRDRSLLLTGVLVLIAALYYLLKRKRIFLK